MRSRPRRHSAKRRGALAARADRILAHREGGTWAWILPGESTPIAQPAEVTLTARSLVLMGENMLELSLDDIIDVVLGGDHLLVELRLGFGLCLAVEQADAFHLELSNARRAFRDGQVDATEPSEPHRPLVELR